MNNLGITDCCVSVFPFTGIFNVCIYLFCLIMLICYNLISSELPVKVDSIN